LWRPRIIVAVVVVLSPTSLSIVFQLPSRPPSIGNVPTPEGFKGKFGRGSGERVVEGRTESRSFRSSITVILVAGVLRDTNKLTLHSFGYVYLDLVSADEITPLPNLVISFKIASLLRVTIGF